MNGFVMGVAIVVIFLSIWFGIEMFIIKRKTRKHEQAMQQRKKELELKKEELKNAKRIVFKAKK